MRERHKRKPPERIVQKEMGQDNARGHFPHNTWLSNILKKPAEHACDQQYGPNGKNQLFSLHSIAFF